MSDGGKKKERNNKKVTTTTSNKSSKKENIVIYTMYGVSLIIIILLFIFSDFLFNIIVKKIVVVSCACISLALIIIPILLEVKRKTKKKFKIWISLAICVVYIFMSAQALMNIGDAGTKGMDDEPNPIADIEEEPVEALFVINFGDGLFSNHTAEYLVKNKNALIEQIIKAIKDGTAVTLEVNYGNYKLYEDSIMQAQDYECVYDKCKEFHIFEMHNKDELVKFLDLAIECRKGGDAAYATCENRRCIALRYNDKGYELCGTENVKESFAAYESAIEYGVGALCVQFSTRSKGNSETEKIIDAIIRGYTGITESTTEDNGNYKKAIVMIEVFEIIKTKL